MNTEPEEEATSQKAPQEPQASQEPEEKPKETINWGAVGAIAGVIGVLITLWQLNKAAPAEPTPTVQEENKSRNITHGDNSPIIQTEEGNVTLDYSKDKQVTIQAGDSTQQNPPE